MGAQSYERVSLSYQHRSESLTPLQVPGSEEDVPETPHEAQEPIPSSPPPPFRSRTSSIASRRHPPQHSAGPVDQTLEDTFDAGPNDENEDEAFEDDRQRLMRDATVNSQTQDSRPGFGRGVTSFPSIFGSNRARTSKPSAISNDGVFANLNAKPERGDKLEEQPPVGSRLLLIFFAWLM